VTALYDARATIAMVLSSKRETHITKFVLKTKICLE